MENSTLIKIIAVVLVVEIILAGAVVALFLKDDGVKGEDSCTLYVGLNDYITHEDYDPEYAANVVDHIVVKYADGFTRYLANGGCVEGTDITYEKSLVYVRSGIDLEKAHEIADEAKKALNQSTIMITLSKQQVEFY